MAIKNIISNYGKKTEEIFMNEKIEKMVNVIKEYDSELRSNLDYKHYYAPNIPEKIINKLIKHFDDHLAVNSIVAFYDTTLLGSGKDGILFTVDGFYYRDFTKPIFINFSDISDINTSKSSITFKLKSNSNDSFSIITVLNYSTFKIVLQKLMRIDSEYGNTSLKSTGKVKKVDIPPDMEKKCHAIIHGASVACGGVGTGLAQIPASDNAVIVPIQSAMIVSLGTVFGLHITESVVKSIIASASATVAGRTASQFLVGWIPVIGNAINTATAAGVTEAIGWLAVRNFYNRWIEDKQKGRFDGMKDGYIEASKEYENKLRRQAEEFLNQTRDYQRERDEYEKLIEDYEEYIRQLEREHAASSKIYEYESICRQLKDLA